MADFHVRRRSVSPMGASRFEQPFEPAPVTARSYHTSSSSASPTTPMSAHTPFSYQSVRSYQSAAQSRPPAAESIFSTDTMETALTSVASHDRPHSSTDDLSSPVCVVSPDDWFARFHSDEELGSTATDECPDRATLAAVQGIPIYNAEGEARPFGSIYDPDGNPHQRQLVIFVRHFYCGACQAYLRALTESITMREYFSIPIPTSIIVIGCGQPDLIPQYKKFSGDCPFPIYAEPSRQLFKKLGMTISANIGRHRPEYMKDIGAASWAAGQVKTIGSSLKDPDGIRKRDVIRGGHPMQIGGEFLFEEGEVVWCHRMKNYRNHAEIKVIRKILELDE